MPINVDDASSGSYAKCSNDASSSAAGDGEETDVPNDPSNNPAHKAELLMYGDMVDAAYMTFAAEEQAQESVLSSQLAQAGGGYVVSTHLYASIHAVPWLLDVHSLDRPYLFGYVAVARRASYWDVVVVWRGSATFADWIMDMHAKLVPFDDGGNGAAGGKVVEGFYEVYTSKDIEKERGKLSAREQVVKEVTRLVSYIMREGSDHQMKSVRVTVTGHSLGGALALMAAHDAAAELEKHDNVQVRAVTFGAPHVGDEVFRKALEDRNVQVVRVNVRQDLVPRLPPMALGTYVDVGGPPVEFDEDRSPLKRGPHNLDLYLHLISSLRDRPAASEPPTKDHKWPNLVEDKDDGCKRLSLDVLDSLKVVMPKSF